MDYYDNITTFLQVRDTNIQTSNDMRVQIFSTSYAMQPTILFFSKYLQWFVVVNAVFVLSIGSYFRYILYECLYDGYKAKEFKPINSLKLLVSVSQHLSIVAYTVFIIYMIVMREWVGHTDGSWYCVFSKHLNRFDYAYSVIGSLGISITPFST